MERFNRWERGLGEAIRESEGKQAGGEAVRGGGDALATSNLTP